MLKGHRLTDKESKLTYFIEAIKLENRINNLISQLELVSTIGDECNQVGVEISTTSKREATDNVEDIVSTFGNKR